MTCARDNQFEITSSLLGNPQLTITPLKLLSWKSNQSASEAWKLANGMEIETSLGHAKDFQHGAIAIARGEIARLLKVRRRSSNLSLIWWRKQSRSPACRIWKPFQIMYWGVRKFGRALESLSVYLTQRKCRRGEGKTLKELRNWSLFNTAKDVWIKSVFAFNWESWDESGVLNHATERKSNIFNIAGNIL